MGVAAFGSFRLDAGPHRHLLPLASLLPARERERGKGEGDTTTEVGLGGEKKGGIIDRSRKVESGSLLHHPHPPTIPCSAFLIMRSSRRLLGRTRSLHDILGGGTVADVMLWRRRDVTVGILLGTLAAWIVFEKSGYTLLSLAASVMLLLISILFVWAKAAAILNRPPPPLPELRLSEEMMKEASVLIHYHINAVLMAWHDISLGKDNKLFYKVAAFLWLISVIGRWTNFLTLGYTSLLIILTVPALYERYEDYVDNYLIMSYGEVQRVYDFNTACFKKVRKWILEKRRILEKIKLS